MTTLMHSVDLESPALGGETPLDSADFAVGFSRQPLPKSQCFAIVTNRGGTGIRATDATARCGLDLISLRPEIHTPITAKRLPTANFFQSPRWAKARRQSSIATGPRAGHNKITNGVRQELFGARLPGVETRL